MTALHKVQHSVQHDTLNSVPHNVVLLGLPTDEASSFARGASRGPAGVRAALYSESSSLMSERGMNLAEEPRFLDVGDLQLPEGDATRAEIERGIAEHLAAGNRILSLGGDHSVAFPILRSYARYFDRLTVVQIDAHPDLYDSFEGDHFSHACPFARVMEEGLAKRLVQIGIRTANQHQRDQAARFGVEQLPRAQWLDVESLQLEGPIYLSIDLDGFDPAFAPGVAHQEAGGLSTGEALDILWQLPNLVGADVVELNPERDPSGITAALAAKLVKELVPRLLE